MTAVPSQPVPSQPVPSQPVPSQPVPTQPPWAPPAAPGSPRPAWQRLLPHLVWEAVLAVVVIAVVVVAAARMPIFDGPAVWWSIAGTGLLATALALSLRTGTVNLAVPAFAGLTSVVLARVMEAGWSFLPAAALALFLVGVLGAVLAVVTWLTSAPAWAVSLGGFGLGYALTMLISGGAPLRVAVSAPSTNLGFVWFALFIIGSVGGGMLFLVPAVQRLIGGGSGVGGSGTGASGTGGSGTGAARDRESGLTAARLVRVLTGFLGSSLLAGVAGLVISTRTLVAMPGVDITWLVMAFGAAVLGGVSVVGGRGGIMGTALGATLLGVITVWLQLERVGNPGLSLLIGGLAVLGGLVVGRILALLAPDNPEAPDTPEATHTLGASGVPFEPGVRGAAYPPARMPEPPSSGRIG